MLRYWNEEPFLRCVMVHYPCPFPMRRFVIATALASCAAAWGAPANAAALSDDVEYRIINNVGTAWITVPLANTYTAAIPICTYVTTSIAVRSAVPRIRNIGPNSFDLRLQEFTGGTNPTANTTPGTVFCVIADTGRHTLEDGRAIEAFSVLSDSTAAQPTGFNIAAATRTDTSIIGSYPNNPIALTGVISSNDAQPSVVWSFDCESRGNPPFNSGFSDGLCVEKHIGQINGTRVDETIGVILSEAGTGTSRGIFYELLRGTNAINGQGSAGSDSYTVGADYDAAIASQMGERGGQGGWATLTGTDPLPSGRINLAIDEELVAGDVSRTHVNENVNVFAFRDDRTVRLEATKDVAAWDPLSTGSKSIPGNEVAYTLTIRNTGDGAADPDSLFLVDALPQELAFFTGDFASGDGETDPVRFTETATNLRFDYAQDVGFSNSTGAAPATMDECSYTPSGTYDSDVRFICVRPRGAMAADTGSGPPTITIEFRGRIQ